MTPTVSGPAETDAPDSRILQLDRSSAKATAPTAPTALSNRTRRAGPAVSDRSPPVKAITARSGGRAGGVERDVLLQDGALDPLQARARLDTEFLHQHPAGRPVDSQRLGLPPATVERDHQLLVQPLPQGVGGGERFQFADHVPMMAKREIGFDPVLDDTGPQLIQPRDLCLRERLIADLSQRRTAPQRQRVAKISRRPAGCASLSARRPSPARRSNRRTSMRSPGARSR